MKSGVHVRPESVFIFAGIRSVVTRLFLPSHYYKDIFLYLDQTQIAMTKLVDGSRTLEEIHAEMAMQPGIGLSENQIVEFFFLMLDHDYLWFRKEPGN